MLGNFSVDCTLHTVKLKLQDVFLGIRLLHLVRFVFEPSLAHEPVGYSSQMNSDTSVYVYAVRKGGKFDLQVID